MLPPFLSEALARRIQRDFGTPVFVYDQRTLEHRAGEVLAFPRAFGFSARYAMKACPTAGVLRILHAAGLGIDASSGYEADRAILAGIAPSQIQITAQELPHNLKALVAEGVLFNACSLHQLEVFGSAFPGSSVSLRLNPSLGSGHNNRTSTGGTNASFGIWHEYLGDALALAKRHGLRLERLHTHIGSGTDPAIWQRAALLALDLCARIPEVTRLSLGGGFKVARMPGEASVDLKRVGEPIAEAFRAFAAQHGREIELEIEPGGYLVANAGALLASVIDVVDTGRDGYRFIKIDSGMTELVRPAMYGAQHPIAVVPANPEARGQGEYLVVGHCCESGDLLTPAPGDPEGLAPRRLLEPRIGDPVVIGGAGAYAASMSAKHYNSFPEAAEVLIRADGEPVLIRKRETMAQLIQNEIL